jgi:putative transposase
MQREGEAPAEPKSFVPRHHPTHGVRSDTHEPIIVFLTVCTKDRAPWLADAAIHLLLREVWTSSDAWLVGFYAILPDHIHLFASPNISWKDRATTEPPSFDNWARYWKSKFTKRHGNPAHCWQVDHWDRRLRREENYANKWEYVRNNPVRHGLVLDSAQWPYQGKLHDLKW